MRTIAEMNLLVRVNMELPAGLKLATDEFREGWEFIQSEDAGWLDKKLRKRGWNFVKIGDGLLKTGIGETSQEAIAGALKLALCRVGELFPAAQVGKIKLTRYPWFCLARVRVYPYWIQRDPAIPAPNWMAPVPRRGRLPRQAEALDRQFAGAVPRLTQVLNSTQTLQDDSR